MATQNRDSGTLDDGDLDLDVDLDDFSLDDEQLFADLDNEVRLDAEPETGGGLKLEANGDDLSLDLEDDAPKPSAKPSAKAGAPPAAKPAPKAAPKAAGKADDLDADLDLGGDLDLDANLDLGGDLDADLDLESELDAEGSAGGDDLDLGGDLDLESELNAGVSAGGPKAAAGDDFDLGDLDTPGSAGGDDEAGGLDLDAGLDFGEDTSAGGDDLDLGGDLDLDGDLGVGDLGGAGAGGDDDLGDLGGAGAGGDDDLGDLSGAGAGGDDDLGDLGGAGAGGDDDLDLGGMDLGAGDAKAGEDDLDLSVDLDLGTGGGDLDLDGDLDLESDLDAGHAKSSALDDLDMGDLAADPEHGSEDIDDLRVDRAPDMDAEDTAEAVGEDLDLGADVGLGEESLEGGELDGLELDDAAADVEALGLDDDVDFSPTFEEETPGTISLEDDEPGLGEPLSLEVGDLDQEPPLDFQAVPDVNLDEVDLAEVGRLDTADGDVESIELDLTDDELSVPDEPFEAVPDVEIDDATLESLGEVQPPDLGGPDPFRVEPREAAPRRAAPRGLRDDWDDDLVSAPDADEPGAEVVELNLDDLEPSSRGRAAWRAPHAAPGRSGPPVRGDSAARAVAAAGAIPADVLLSVPRQVSVEVGSVTLNGRDLLNLAYGSVVQLDQVVGDPVELVLEGRTIAKGEIVLINGRSLGVRIVSLDS